MVPIIEWEGYTDATYTDHKGVATTGVGQTGQYVNKTFPETFYAKKEELLKYTPNLSSFPDEVQDAILVSHYRGDWVGSPKTRALFDQGMYKEAAKEYLNNKDYKEGIPGIQKRFEYVATAIESMA